MVNIVTGRLAAAALIGSSLMATPTMASAAACQTNGAGCLLPLAQTTAIAQPAPVAAAPVAAAPVVAEEVGRGFPFLLLLGGLAVAGGILALVLTNDDDDAPVSP